MLSPWMLEDRLISISVCCFYSGTTNVEIYTTPVNSTTTPTVQEIPLMDRTRLLLLAFVS